MTVRPRFADAEISRRAFFGYAAGASAVLLGLPSCAPYRLGTESLYSCKIQTVYVPIFESATFRRGLGERLTEAVQKEIERRTPFKVVSSPDADSILTGKIVTEAKGVTVQAPTSEAREITTYWTVRVQWIDRGGVIVQDMPSVALPADLQNFQQLQSNATFYPEVGQSLATSQQDSINRIARQIVGMMEAPW